MKQNPYRKDYVDRVSKINELGIHNMEVAEDILATKVTDERRKDDLVIKRIKREWKQAAKKALHRDHRPKGI